MMNEMSFWASAIIGRHCAGSIQTKFAGGVKIRSNIAGAAYAKWCLPHLEPGLRMKNKLANQSKWPCQALWRCLSIWPAELGLGAADSSHCQDNNSLPLPTSTSQECRFTDLHAKIGQKKLELATLKGRLNTDESSLSSICHRQLKS